MDTMERASREWSPDHWLAGFAACMGEGLESLMSCSPGLTKVWYGATLPPPGDIFLSGAGRLGRTDSFLFWAGRPARTESFSFLGRPAGPDGFLFWIQGPAPGFIFRGFIS